MSTDLYIYICIYIVEHVFCCDTSVDLIGINVHSVLKLRVPNSKYAALRRLQTNSSLVSYIQVHSC